MPRRTKYPLRRVALAASLGLALLLSGASAQGQAGPKSHMPRPAVRAEPDRATPWGQALRRWLATPQPEACFATAPGIEIAADCARRR